MAALRRQRGDGLTFQLSRSTRGRTRVAQVSFGHDRERHSAGDSGITPGARFGDARCSGTRSGRRRSVQSRTEARSAQSSATRPPAATSAGMAACSPRCTPANAVARSPPSVSAPRPAHIRTADGEASARVVATRPPIPSTISRTAKLCVMRVSLPLPCDLPFSRSGASAKATPTATLIPAKTRTTFFALTLTTSLKVADQSHLRVLRQPAPPRPCTDLAIQGRSRRARNSQGDPKERT
jgi:hypothetical protein